MADRTYLDWPFFEEKHRLLARDLDDWCKTNISLVDHSDIDAACLSLVKMLGDNEWLKYSAIDPQDETSKLDVRSLCIIRETLARYDGLADFAFAMQGLGSGAISLFGTQEQKERWLPGVRSGELVSAFALTEPGSGSDVANSTMTAKLDGDHYILNGQKTWISNGGIADIYTLFARTGDAPGAKGLSAFVIDAKVEGLTISERLETIAPHPLATLEFNDCRIPKSALIGNSGEGFKIAMSVLDVFRSTVAAAALGFARRAMDEAIEHSSNRTIQNAPLTDYQMVQGHLADMALNIDASALLIYRAAWLKDSGAPRISREASMAKLFSTEQAQKVVDQAVQLHGGEGVRSGNKVEQLYREIRALRIYEGASDVQKIIIARQTLTAHETIT